MRASTNANHFARQCVSIGSFRFGLIFFFVFFLLFALAIWFRLSWCLFKVNDLYVSFRCGFVCLFLCLCRVRVSIFVFVYLFVYFLRLNTIYYLLIGSLGHVSLFCQFYFLFFIFFCVSTVNYSRRKSPKQKCNTDNIL